MNATFQHNQDLLLPGPDHAMMACHLTHTPAEGSGCRFWNSSCYPWVKSQATIVHKLTEMSHSFKKNSLQNKFNHSNDYEHILHNCNRFDPLPLA